MEFPAKQIDIFGNEDYETAKFLASGYVEARIGQTWYEGLGSFGREFQIWKGSEVVAKVIRSDNSFVVKTRESMKPTRETTVKVTPSR